MANKKPKKIQDISGTFIYQDPKHGTVFYDIFTKRGFNLTTSDLQMALYYNVLFPTAVLVILSLISFLKVDFKIAASVGVIAYVLAEILFRVCYFYKLPVIDNYKPIKKDCILVRFAKKYSPQRLVVLALLLAGIAVCTVIYGKLEKLSDYSLYAGYAIATICVVAAILSLVAIVIKKKNNY